MSPQSIRIENQERAVPCQQKRLVQIVENIHHHIPIRGHVDNGTRKLAIDRDYLTPTGTGRGRQVNRTEGNPNQEISNFFMCNVDREGSLDS